MKSTSYWPFCCPLSALLGDLFEILLAIRNATLLHTLCWAAASGTVYDDMSLLSRVVIDMTHVLAVRVGVFVGKPMLIILLGVGVDSYEAFWPEGAWATWFVEDVFDTHIYEITDERDDLAKHSLFFWTAVALKYYSLGERESLGGGA